MLKRDGMYKLIVQLWDLNSPGNPLIHEIHSQHCSSIQEAMESYDGKEEFKVYLAIEEELMKSVDEIKARINQND